MKIIGFTYRDGKNHMIMRGDSSLLNQRKPFFVPQWTQDMRYTPCVVLRISRLGKTVEPRFAYRYWDSWAYGLDFVAEDILRQAIAEGDSWTRAAAFDNSLAVGTWLDCNQDMPKADMVCSPEEAIAQVSRLMTIRQGDLLYIDYKQSPLAVEREHVLNRRHGEEEVLYCKIK